MSSVKYLETKMKHTEVTRTEQNVVMLQSGIDLYIIVCYVCPICIVTKYLVDSNIKLSLDSDTVSHLHCP